NRFIERALVPTKERIWSAFVWIWRVDIGEGDQITFGERSQLCPFFCTEKSSGRISKCDTCGHSGLLRQAIEYAQDYPIRQAGCIKYGLGLCRRQGSLILGSFIVAPS